MIIDKTDSYFVFLLLKINNFQTVRILKFFLIHLSKKMLTLKRTNVILDFSGLINIELKKILLFSQLSELHRNNDKSFVIVCEGLAYDELPDELVVVPTFKEAEDIIEIEDIERDLGI